MQGQSDVLSQISMVTANFGEGVVFADIINDWFKFLGGKPGEVVVVDCGSSQETQTVYWKMFQEGLIDKLQLIHDDSDDFGKDKGYIKEYTAGAIASKPYVLVFKTDTLPYRQGHDNWLEEAIGYLDRDDVFAIGGSYNGPAKYADAWPGWYFSRKCSYNFAIMKRSAFIAAAHEFANDFILSGFKGDNPAVKDDQDRYFIEVAFEQYMEHHKLYTLMKIEDPNWTVFHTNTHDERLQQTREKYLARQDIHKYMNCGYGEEEWDFAKLGRLVKYYGLPDAEISPMKRLQIEFGASPLGSYWRSLKEKMRLKVS